MKEFQVDVSKLWANRLVGDWKLPEEERFTKTNVWHLYRDKTVEGEPLISGLLGPVWLKTLTYEPAFKISPAPAPVAPL